ncbi:MAG: hypothetical protein U9Q63_03525 [Patescibacteria group bacterium]|nr:hypothetical protein [Patescibacteria group bacterium]
MKKTMKKAAIITSLMLVATIILTGCGKSSKQNDCEKACENLSGKQKSLCLSTCKKAVEQYDKQGKVDFDENESAGVGNISNDVPEGEVIGDDYEMAKPNTNNSDTKEVCDENWTNFECEELNGQYKDACYSGIAEDKAQECICANKVEDSTLKDSCNMSVAEQKSDYTICDNIISSNTQDACYVAVAEKTKTVDPCNKINNSMFKDGCYQTIASLNSDISICGMISSSALQTACEIEVGSQ